MSDTNIEIEKRLREQMSSKSPEARITSALSMFSFAKQLALARILQDGPLPPGILRQRLFLHFYGRDFDERTLQKILLHLDRVEDP